MGVQKVLIVVSVLTSALVGLSLIPVLTRSYSEADFSLLSILLVLNSFFGVSDGLRPSVVKHFAKSSGGIPCGGVALLSFGWGGLAALLLYLVLVVFVGQYFSSIDAFMLAVSIFVYIQYTALWGVLDLNDRVGTGAFIRSMGTSSLYIVFSVAPLVFDVVPLAVLFLFVQVVVLIVYGFYCAKYIDGYFAGLDSFSALAPLVRYTLQQNLSKAVCDFLDRIFVSATAGAGIVSLYNVCFELSSKTNLPNQMYSSYMYPVLCKESYSIFRYLNVGLFVSSLMLVFSILIQPWISPIFAFYTGLEGEMGGGLVSCMLVLASAYALAFYGQAAMRASGDFLLLKRVFFYCACGGVVIIYPAYVHFGLRGIIVSAFIMKLPGVFVYFHYYLIKNNSPSMGKIFLLYVVALTSVFFLFLGEV